MTRTSPQSRLQQWLALLLLSLAFIGQGAMAAAPKLNALEMQAVMAQPAMDCHGQMESMIEQASDCCGGIHNSDHCNHSAQVECDNGCSQCQSGMSSVSALITFTWHQHEMPSIAPVVQTYQFDSVVLESDNRPPIA